MVMAVSTIKGRRSIQAHGVMVIPIPQLLRANLSCYCTRKGSALDSCAILYCSVGLEAVGGVQECGAKGWRLKDNDKDERWQIE